MSIKGGVPKLRCVCLTLGEGGKGVKLRTDFGAAITKLRAFYSHTKA